MLLTTFFLTTFTSKAVFVILRFETNERDDFILKILFFVVHYYYYLIKFPFCD